MQQQQQQQQTRDVTAGQMSSAFQNVYVLSDSTAVQIQV
jgi:hypothetical protein